MISGDLLAALDGVVDALGRLDVRYQLVGGLASSVRGMSRSTIDVDLVADLRRSHVSPLVRALEETYYIAEEAVSAAVEARSGFNVMHLGTMTKVDIYAAENDAFTRAELARATPRTLVEGERQIMVQSQEDSVLRKLAWYRRGREVSERQWNDVLGVLRVQARTLDMDYLRRWAPHLGVADLLVRSLEEARQPPV